LCLKEKRRIIFTEFGIELNGNNFIEKGFIQLSKFKTPYNGNFINKFLIPQEYNNCNFFLMAQRFNNETIKLQPLWLRQKIYNEFLMILNKNNPTCFTFTYSNIINESILNKTIDQSELLTISSSIELQYKTTE
jgi:hypothetical protein